MQISSGSTAHSSYFSGLPNEHDSFPVAANAATHGPRSVSISTLTMAAAPPGSRSTHSTGVCSPISACNRVTPSRPSGRRRRASTRPMSSTISTVRPSVHRMRNDRSGAGCVILRMEAGSLHRVVLRSLQAFSGS